MLCVAQDGELVCRHAQCDLHTTTNILGTSLASKCTQPFGHSDGPKCCTSDITLAEFRTLRGKMDASVSGAATAEEYMGGTADWRTDLYSKGKHGKLVTHAESVALIKKWGRKATPELKTYTQGPGMLTYDAVRAKLVQEFKDASFPAEHVWLQSFNLPDVEYWIKNAPEFGKQAVYLDNAYCDGTRSGCTDAESPLVVGFPQLKDKGINYIAPPMQMLVKKSGSGYAASEYATAAKAAGVKIITWTLERSGPLGGGGGWYYGTINDNVDNDGDMLELLHVLHTDVGIEGIFTDWPATVTFYANCLGINDPPATTSLPHDKVAAVESTGETPETSVDSPKNGQTAETIGMLIFSFRCVNCSE